MSTIHEDGRQPIGVCQPPGQGGDDYPLLYPSADINQLLADLHLAYEDPDQEFVFPLRISWLYGFGSTSVTIPVTPTHDQDLKIVDAVGTTVFDSSLATTFESVAWSSRFTVLKWIDSVGQILRVIFHTAWPSTEDVREYDVFIAPANAILDPRATYALPRGVRSLRVGVTTVSGESVVFRNGYNTEITVGETSATDGRRRQTTLDLSAEAGSGFGRVPADCGEEAGVAGFVTTINNVEPDESGNFHIDASGCYLLDIPILNFIVPDQIRLLNHTLRLSNQCSPCCDCQDYVNVYEALRKLTQRYADLISEAQAARDQYHENLRRFQESAACRQSDSSRLVVQGFCPSGDFGVAAGYCNNTDECIRGLVIHISFANYTNDTDCTEKDVKGEGSDVAPFAVNTLPVFLEIVAGSTFIQGESDRSFIDARSGGSPSRSRPYRLGGTWPHFWARWSSVNPGALAAVSFRMRFTPPAAGSSTRIEVMSHAFQVGNAAVLRNGSLVPGYALASGPIDTPPHMLLSPCPQYREGVLITTC